MNLELINMVMGAGGGCIPLPGVCPASREAWFG